jgi:hypothetical protein
MLNLSSANAALSEQCSSRRRLAYPASMVAGAVFVTLLGISSALAQEPVAVSRSALESQACSQTLGLEPSEAGYAACVRSLEQTLYLGDNATAGIADLHSAGTSQAGSIAGR